MSIIHWNPLKKLNKLRQDMNAVFEETMHGEHLFDFHLFPDRLDLTWSPAIAMSETEQKLILKVELPGIEAKDLDVRERAFEELTEPKNNGNNIQEEAREVMVEQRQQEKHHQENMHYRTADEVSK